MFRAYWEYAAFVANSLNFLLIGLSELHLVEDLGGHSATIGYVVAGFVIVTLARVVVVFGFSWICNLFRTDDPISTPEQKVMWWGGLRGAVPPALMMGLPPDLESRTLLVQLTLGVVLLSLLVQGTTTGKLLRRRDSKRQDVATGQLIRLWSAGEQKTVRCRSRNWCTGGSGSDRRCGRVGHTRNAERHTLKGRNNR